MAEISSSIDIPGLWWLAAAGLAQEAIDGGTRELLSHAGREEGEGKQLDAMSVMPLTVNSGADDALDRDSQWPLDPREILFLVSTPTCTLRVPSVSLGFLVRLELEFSFPSSQSSISCSRHHFHHSAASFFIEEASRSLHRAFSNFSELLVHHLVFRAQV
ncbi:hypothetical protein LR48_Vigan07g217300 [Vigna angularis]|uniref:Uncharacterized protein n=1 Tax=Phaseolus angularis TaxID=3914 RepID=A0A0L9V158_PHAAN|nr:hypothetical protein LR48_Vigan07g217300 [Vigna angularis]